MSPDRLSTTFSALADPTRRAILARLASGETSVTELAEPFEMSMPAISKTLKVLYRAGARTAMEAVPVGGGSLEGHRGLAGALPPLLGGELQSSGRISIGTSSP